ncbi:AraC family transcriptional regulator [Hafnia alvei]|uniref:AraC family transcriptional regulator n=1 Tax=Hafnia alvei TaxID=569 RepID=UPI0028BDE8A4|nr:AraC family transcriptional regulator [Hafnia alvei]WNN51054.1 AraC family transcriptional regulator [Hafnia alvei]
MTCCWKFICFSTIFKHRRHTGKAVSGEISLSWLRDNFFAPLEIEQLANLAHMSVSTFHRHFRKVTSFSPLQFQKRLRLYEAQRLMSVEELDGTTAAFQVGYGSASQFNREYKREFGNPPQRDINRMRVASV